MLQSWSPISRMVFLVACLVALPTDHGLPGEHAGLQSATPAIIGLKTTTSTWRARGRVSFPLAAAIRNRLAAAGLHTAPVSESEIAPAAPPVMLQVIYREERGKQVTLDIYGTEVTCDLVLTQLGELLHLTITETPTYGSLSTLPYVDVIHRLETNPYFYFLGDLVQGALQGRTPAASLLIAVARQVELPAPAVTDALPESVDALPTFGPHYQLEALGRTSKS
jgi:hypothetical protein